MPNLYLIRGLPGSGKSALAKTMANSLRAVWFEADHFFLQKGEYQFDPAKLHRAHKWCMGQTEEAMAGGMANIIVSNTFTREGELAWYMSAAAQRGYTVTTIIVENRHGQESLHNVPAETMARMKERFSIQL